MTIRGGGDNGPFNLSDWALRHRSLVTYLMLVIAAAGVWSYLRLGRSEDPDFTVKTMVVQAAWPGATVADTLGQVTDRIESKLQETPKHFVYSPRSDFSTKSRSGSSATLMCDI